MASMEPIPITYIGGPTALSEMGRLRLLTDPTLDPAGSDYPTPAYTLHKTIAPALPAGGLGPVGAVLLSHDHHFDNLDRAGRASLAEAGAVYTTRAGAERLGQRAVGLEPWQRVTLRGRDGTTIELTATPARHGPAHSDRGPVIGFALRQSGSAPWALYLSGDTVWYQGVQEVGRRFRIGVALLNLGAAQVAAAGPHPLTFTATEAVELARAWPDTLIMPLHFEGWAHSTEGRAEVEQAFEAAGLASRLRWLPPGAMFRLPLAPAKPE